MSDQQLTSQAIDSVAQLAQKAYSVTNILSIVPLDDYRFVTVTKEGAILSNKLTRTELPLVGINQIAPFINFCPWPNIFVTISACSVVIHADANMELKLDRLLLTTNLRLNSCLAELLGAPNPYSQSEMQMHLKCSPLYSAISNSDQLIDQVGRIKWKTVSGGHEGVSNDRSTYGSIADSEAIIGDDDSSRETLGDVLINLPLYTDPGLRACVCTIRCFWVYNHVQRKLHLAPYGGQYAEAVELTLNYLETLLREQIDVTDDLRVSVQRG